MRFVQSRRGVYPYEQKAFAADLTNGSKTDIIRMLLLMRTQAAADNQSGPVAQLGARFHGMEEVIGSIPIRSTKIKQISRPAGRLFYCARRVVQA